MQKIKVGDKLQIHCYKHNGKLHRICDEATVLEVDENHLICANNKTKMTEKETIFDKFFHSYKTKEPAILFFYKKKWFNIIGQLKEKGIYYYCNIASPYIIDDGLIKYIDYDLDLRVFPDGAFKILDRKEYNIHKRILKYDNKIDKIVNSELSNLINYYRNGEGPFNEKTLNSYYLKYQNLKNDKK